MSEGHSSGGVLRKQKAAPNTRDTTSHTQFDCATENATPATTHTSPTVHTARPFNLTETPLTRQFTNQQKGPGTTIRQYQAPRTHSEGSGILQAVNSALHGILRVLSLALRTASNLLRLPLSFLRGITSHLPDGLLGLANNLVLHLIETHDNSLTSADPAAGTTPGPINLHIFDHLHHQQREHQ